MSNDDGRLFLGAILGFGGGIYTFVRGFREYRKYRVVADTPTIRIRSVPMGLVQIRGEACAEETFVSPVTRTPCYLFQVVVEEWHSESRGGGEWKHVLTDLQSVKFDLQDDSGNILVDATNAELDLPASPVREVRSFASTATPSSSAQKQVAGALAGTSAMDGELLQYVEQARVRHVGQMVGKGIGLLTHTADSTSSSPAQAFLNMLADPGGGGGQGTQAGLAALGPGKHGGGVKRALWGGAVAGRFAAAGFQFIDGAFEELAKRQEIFEALLVVSQQGPYVLAQMAGALGVGGHGQLSLYVIYHNNIKKSICFTGKMMAGRKFLWRHGDRRRGGLTVETRPSSRGPVVSGFQQHLPGGRPCGPPGGEFTV
jgi:hypothetical protein